MILDNYYLTLFHYNMIPANRFYSSRTRYTTLSDVKQSLESRNSRNDVILPPSSANTGMDSDIEELSEELEDDAVSEPA